VASIRLYLETLQTRPVDEAKRKEFYQVMLEDSDRLLSTIEQVLRTGRVGSAAHRLNPTRIDLDEVVRSSVELVRTLHRVPAQSVRYQPCGPATLLGDLEKIRAAISNLIDNAVKYSAAEVNVTVETAKLDERFVILRVKDQGPGIPKTELNRVFRRFYRVPGPLAARIKGTGLGLYIVRSVAKRHGGRAWAESEGPGHGSTFALQLPIAK
jgi:signal transduction histidine kinase